MAFIGTPSTTAGTILGSTVANFYEKTMLEWMRPNWRFYTFATKKPIPQNSGNAVRWNRKVPLGMGYVLSQGVPMCALKTISSNMVSALLEQLGDQVHVSDYARLTSTIDTDAYALEIMADQATNSVEQYIIENLVAETASTHYVKVDGGLAGYNTALTGAGATPTISVHSTGINSRLALSDIRAAVTKLQANDVPTYDGNAYIGIAHPNQLATLYSDSAFVSWAQFKTPERMYDYEVGRVYDCSVITSTKVPIAPGSTLSPCSISTATGSAYKVYGMVVFGKDAYGVTEIDGAFKTFKQTGSQKADVLNMADGYGWKANIASKVLNPSALVFLWSGVGEGPIPLGDAQNVLGNSGRYAKGQGINCLFPSTITAFYPTIFQSW